MALFTIKKGRHQDNRPFSSWPHFGKRSIARYVTFGEGCRYSLPQHNSLDVNKLFGLSFGFFAVHENSARFGWRWNEADQCIDLLAYCYVNGKRNWDEQMNFPLVAQVKIGQSVECSIRLDRNCYIFNAREAHGTLGAPADFRKPLGSVLVAADLSLPNYGLTHSLYFGGFLPAPHDMSVVMTKA